MIEMVRPRFFIPVHGEYRQLHHHAVVALESGIPPENLLVIEDGRVVELTPEGMRAPDEASVAGLVFVDGLRVGDAEQGVLSDPRGPAGARPPGGHVRGERPSGEG